MDKGAERKLIEEHGEPLFYESIGEYEMADKERKRKYLTIERFEKFLSNDFYHLQRDVRENKWLLRILVGGLLVLVLFERFVG